LLNVYIIGVLQEFFPNERRVEQLKKGQHSLRNHSLCSLENVISESELLKRSIPSVLQVKIDDSWRHSVRVCSAHCPVCDKSKRSVL